MMEYQTAPEVIYNHASNQAYRSAKLGDKFKLERNGVSPVYLHQKAVKNANNVEQKSRAFPQRQEQRNKADELVRYMSNLPGYLEAGEKLKERPFNYGVLEWRRLEKWKYNQSCESSPSKSSNTNASSFSSPEGSSSSSGRGHNSLSPVRQRMQPNRSPSPGRVSSRGIKSLERNGRKFQDLAASSSNYVKVSQSILSTHKCFHKYTDNKKSPEPPRTSEKRESQAECLRVSGSEGNKKVQECEASEKAGSPTVDRSMGTKDGVECSSYVTPRKSLAGYDEQEKMEARRLSFSDISNYDTDELPSVVPHSCPFPREAGTFASVRSPGKFSDRNLVGIKSVQAFSSSSEVLGRKFNSEEDGKLRSPSPIRRLMAKVVRNSNTKDTSCQSPSSPSAVRSRRAETAVSPADSPREKSVKGRSSPLRRMLDPLLKPRTSNADSSTDSVQKDASRNSAKVRLDLGSCKTIDVDHPQGTGKRVMVQALLRVAVKNGLPLFTFADDNSSDILAATMRKLSSGKKDENRWIYTFFTIHEMKKKNGSWLNQGSKDRNPGYVPNVVAQMKVSDQCTSTREFVLVATKNDEQQVNEELGATVLNLPIKKSLSKVELEPCGISVVLPDGDHGLPSEGEPSPLLDRWRSGGSCDCGGWDLGCRYKVITSQQTKPESSSGKFQLHSQNQEPNRKPVFSMSPFKDGIYSVEFDSSLKLIQAFSICIAILNGLQAEWQSDSV